MEGTSAAVFLNVVNSFTDADQLMDFAATWGIQKETSAKSARFMTPNICIDFVLLASFKLGFIYYFPSRKEMNNQHVFDDIYCFKSLCTCNKTFYKRVRYCGKNANNHFSYTR